MRGFRCRPTVISRLPDLRIRHHLLADGFEVPPELSIHPRRPSDDAERQLLLEVARLYAALARVLRTGDIDELHADLSDLLTPPAPPRRTPHMFTAAFWRASAERALKSGAQFAVAGMGADYLGWSAFQASLATVAGAFGVGALLSVLTSLASSTVGVHGSPSLAPAAEVEAVEGPAGP